MSDSDRKSPRPRKYHCKDANTFTFPCPGGTSIVAAVPFGQPNIGLAERVVSAAKTAAAFVNDGAPVVDLAGKLAELKTVIGQRDELFDHVGELAGERDELRHKLAGADKAVVDLARVNGELRRQLDDRARADGLTPAGRFAAPLRWAVSAETIKRGLRDFLGLPETASIRLQVVVPGEPAKAAR